MLNMFVREQSLLCFINVSATSVANQQVQEFQSTLSLFYETVLCRTPLRRFISWRVRKIAKSDYCFVTSVCLSAWNISAPTERIFMKFIISVFFEHLWIKFQLH